MKARGTKTVVKDAKEGLSLRLKKHISETTTAWSGRIMCLEKAAELDLLSGDIYSDKSN